MVAEVKDFYYRPTMQNREAALPRNMLTAEIGASGLRRFGGYVVEDFDPQLNGFRAAAVFDEMRRNDPDVSSLLSAIEFIVHSVDWSVAPGGTSKADDEAAVFVRQCMDDMDISWHDFISDVCSIFPFGWAWFEQIWKQRNGLSPSVGAPSLYDDGRIGWKNMALRGQESLWRWDFEEHGEIEAMHQRILWSPLPKVISGSPNNTVGGEYVIPMAKSVLFRVKREKNNPEGWSILRPCYRPYYIKKNIEEIEIQGAEKDMVGTLVIRLPANATAQDREAAQRILEDYHTGDQVGLLLPRVVNDPTLLEMDWHAELMKAPGNKVVDTDKIITRCSVMIMRSSLAQFLSLGQAKAGGSKALGESMMDLFRLAVNGHLDNIQHTINRFMVRKLFELNDWPGLTRLPEIHHGDLGEMDMKEFVDAITRLHNTGFPLDDPEAVNLVRKKLGLPEMESDDILQMQMLQRQAQMAKGGQRWQDTGALSTTRRENTNVTDNVSPGGTTSAPKGTIGKSTNSMAPATSGAQPVMQGKKTATEWVQLLTEVGRREE